jgi:nickel-dependent lactate racemase
MSSAEMVIEKGGVIVLIAECRDGVGKYAQWLKQAQAPEEVIERFKKEGFTADHSSKAFMCARALARHEVVIACSGISEKELAQMFFTPAASPQAAIDTALDRIGPDARVLVLPNAVNCVPRVAA